MRAQNDGKCFVHPRMSWLRILFAIPEVMVASTVSLVAENLAVILMWFGDWYSFYIVQKEVKGMDGLSDMDEVDKQPLIATSNNNDKSDGTGAFEV